MLQTLNNWINAHYKISAFLVGSLAVQALPPFYHWYVLFISFSTLLLLLNNASGIKQAFACGYWFGFGYFAFGFAWVNNALLVHPDQTGWLIPITFIASGLFFGFFFGLPTFLSYLVRPLSLRYLSLAAWIVIFEWMRSWFLTGFPWNLLGTCLAFDLRLIQSAAIFGTYGLSLLVVTISAAPALWLNDKTISKFLLCAGIIGGLLTINISLGSYRINELKSTTNSLYKIRLVQPSIPQAAKWSRDMLQMNFQDYINLTLSQPLDDIDMVIWGETASPYALDRDKKAISQIVSAIPKQGFLLTGMIRYENNYYGGWNAFNSAVIINSLGTIEDAYDKSHLVPFGEYIPLKHLLPDFIKPVANIIGTFKAGMGPRTISLPGIPPLGLQICYEIIFPRHVISSFPKPRWLINLTNDGWYGMSSGPHQHLVNTQLRAIEEGITIVRSANSGISAVINRYGLILTSLKLQHRGIVDINLPRQMSVYTVYNYAGNIPIFLICIILLGFCFYRNNKLKINSKQ